MTAANFTGLLRGPRVAVVAFTSLRLKSFRYAGHAYAKAAAEMYELRLGVACFEVDVADPQLHALCLSLGVDAVRCGTYLLEADLRQFVTARMDAELRPGLEVLVSCMHA
jgi:hypothetical protein